MENNAPFIPPAQTPTQIPPSGTPSQAQQQWGVVISIVVIVTMIIVGAFYAWGKRISESQVLPTSITTQ